MILSPEYVKNAEDVIARATRYAKSGADKNRYEFTRLFCKPFKKILCVGSAGYEPVIIGATHALDVSPIAGKYLKQNNWKGNFIEGSCTDLPFKDNSFECGVCTETIEHLPKIEDVEATLKEIDRVCDNWLVSTPSVPVPEPDHKHFFAPEQITKWVDYYKLLACNKYQVKVYTRHIWHFIIKRHIDHMRDKVFCQKQAPKGAWHD